MKAQTHLSGKYEPDCLALDAALRISSSFDLVARDFAIGGRRARLYFIDGFAKDDIMEKILEFLLLVSKGKLEQVSDISLFCSRFIPYVETDTAQEIGKITTLVLSGTIALLVEGFCGAILIDARTYPARSVGEPDDDRVLRGSHDGFVETLVMNTALIRRRLRDPQLTMRYVQATEDSRADIVLCYMENLTDKKLVESLVQRIASIPAKTLTMAQESLAESLIKRQWYNPFPRVRYTERPDAAAACVAEGKIAIIIDNSPSVMILPTTLFDFVQDTNDFYFPPLIGTYLRILRIFIFFLTVFLTPVWFLLVQNPQWIPPALEFIQIESPTAVPVIFQLLIIELVLDGLRLASLNTPGALNTSFSVVSALLLGDFAVSAEWLCAEVVLYMAFVATGNFTQPSFELGYAFKLSRVLLLILTALFNVWGFVVGNLLVLLILATTRTITGKSYLFPLIPFHPRAFFGLFIRRPISRKDT